MQQHPDIKSSQVFICYAREDIECAERLYDDLKTHGFSPFMDKFSILPGQDWKQEIEKAIKRSRFVLALLSTHSLSKKGYVQREIRAAIDNAQEFPESEIYIIPLRLDSCEPHDKALNALQYADMFPSWEIGYAKVLETIDVALSQDYTQDLDMAAFGQWIYIGNYNREAGQWVENYNGYLATIRRVEHYSPQGLVYKTVEIGRDTNVRQQPGIQERKLWILRKGASAKILAVFEAFHYNPVVRRVWAAVARPLD